MFLGIIRSLDNTVTQLIRETATPTDMVGMIDSYYSVLIERVY